MGRARTLRFLAHDVYVSERSVGFLLLNTYKPMSLSTARMFKPAGMSAGTLQWSHSEAVSFHDIGSFCTLLRHN